MTPRELTVEFERMPSWAQNAEILVNNGEDEYEINRLNCSAAEGIRIYLDRKSVETEWEIGFEEGFKHAKTLAKEFLQEDREYFKKEMLLFLSMVCSEDQFGDDVLKGDI